MRGGKRGDMWGYLSDFAGSKETFGKLFFWAVKPKKNCSKNKETSEEEINGWVRHYLLRL
jgi:hypothetical protein